MIFYFLVGAAILGLLASPALLHLLPASMTSLDLYVGGSDLLVGVLSDPASATFSFLVGTISAVVFFWALEYMGLDKDMYRFLLILFSFVVSMVLLFTAPSYWMMLLGWDGLGITSFALIVYYQSKESLESGFTTLLINRIGDCLLIFLFMSFALAGTSWVGVKEMSVLALFVLVVGAFTKSAQYPFSSWLPAAMAAPTPVSALVHSSTLVTAGIFLLIRFESVALSSEVSKELMMFAGGLTALLAGIFALQEYDLKKIIAYSTLSQLGLMVLALGLNSTQAAFFHLLMHAIFKAMMFLVGGMVLNVTFGAQSLRLLKGSLLKHPFYLAVFIVASLNLVAIPFMSAYFSKHMILELFALNSKATLSMVLGLLSFITTWGYATRTILYLVESGPSPLSLKNNSVFVLVPLTVLVSLAVVWGHAMSSAFLGGAVCSPEWLQSSVWGFALCALGPLALLKSKVSPTVNSMVYLTPFNKAVAGLLAKAPSQLTSDTVFLSPGTWSFTPSVSSVGSLYVKWLPHMKTSAGVLLLCILLLTF